MVPGVLRALVENERQRRTDLALFEVGSTHRWQDGAPAETPTLSLAAVGDAAPASWQQPVRLFEVDDLKGLIAWLVDRVAGSAVRFTAAVPRTSIDHPGRLASVVVELDGQPRELGRVGELHPDLLASYDVQARQVVFGELALDTLASLVPSQRLAGTVDRLPVVERDIAIELAVDRAAGEVEAVIREAAGPELQELRLFDRYQGPPLAAGQVSLGYRLRFQPQDGAFGDLTVDDRISTIVTALSDRVGGRLRG
jgi:phenylalanyl-tRNA synthetase beta chain